MPTTHQSVTPVVRTGRRVATRSEVAAGRASLEPPYEPPSRAIRRVRQSMQRPIERSASNTAPCDQMHPLQPLLDLVAIIDGGIEPASAPVKSLNPFATQNGAVPDVIEDNHQMYLGTFQSSFASPPPTHSLSEQIPNPFASTSFQESRDETEVPTTFMDSSLRQAHSNPFHSSLTDNDRPQSSTITNPFSLSRYQGKECITPPWSSSANSTNTLPNPFYNPFSVTQQTTNSRRRTFSQTSCNMSQMNDYSDCVGTSGPGHDETRQSNPNRHYDVSSDIDMLGLIHDAEFLVSGPSYDSPQTMPCTSYSIGSPSDMESWASPPSNHSPGSDSTGSRAIMQTSMYGADMQLPSVTASQFSAPKRSTELVDEFEEMLQVQPRRHFQSAEQLCADIGCHRCYDLHCSCECHLPGGIGRFYHGEWPEDEVAFDSMPEMVAQSVGSERASISEAVPEEAARSGAIRRRAARWSRPSGRYFRFKRRPGRGGICL